MERNDYGDLIERWKVELIRKRARRFSFREDEIDDLEQLIVPELLKAEFDPNHAARAAERSFVITVIDRRLLSAIRERGRDVRRVNYDADGLEEENALPGEEPRSPDRPDNLELALDLERAMADLGPDEKAICKALMDGMSQADIARATGRSRPAICREVRKLRAVFRTLGLDDYLGRKANT